MPYPKPIIKPNNGIVSESASDMQQALTKWKRENEERLQKRLRKRIGRTGFEHLLNSGLSLQTIDKSGIRIAHDVNGVIIPYFDIEGEVIPYSRIRVFDEDGIGKYQQSQGETHRIYFAPTTLKKLMDGESDIIHTEGEKKALAAAEAGYAAIGIPGIEMWHNKSRRDLHADIIDLPLVGRDHYVVFDYDEDEKTRTKTRNHQRAYASELRKWAGATGGVYEVNLPPGPGGKKQGVDDFIMRHGADAFHELLAEAKRTSRDNFDPIPFAHLALDCSDRRPVVVDGILREGETANLIAPPKIGKTLLSYGLGLSIANGAPWLGRFETSQGRVLYIDNELHREELFYRLDLVAKQLGLSTENVEVLSLRGRLIDYTRLEQIVSQKFERGQYRAIFVDAHYRMLPEGTDENDNGAIKDVYNLIDLMGEHTRAAWILVHHPSKGDQSGKVVTDMGAGAGSQSRAPDAHLVFRPHQKDTKNDRVLILDGAVRSFPPLPEVCVRWKFPVLVPAPDLDPTALKTPTTAVKDKKDDLDKRRILDALATQKGEPITVNTICELMGVSPSPRWKGLVKGLVGKVVGTRKVDASGNPADGYFLITPPPDSTDDGRGGGGVRTPKGGSHSPLPSPQPSSGQRRGLTLSQRLGVPNRLLNRTGGN